VNTGRSMSESEFHSEKGCLNSERVEQLKKDFLFDPFFGDAVGYVWVKLTMSKIVSFLRVDAVRGRLVCTLHYWELRQ